MSLYRRGGKPGSVWYSRIVRGGNVIVRSTRKRARGEAVKVEAQWIAEIDSHGGVIARKAKPVFLHEFFEKRFEPYLQIGVKGERTRQFYKDAAKPLLLGGDGWMGLGAEYLSNITPAMIENWVQKRAKDGVGPSSINGSLRTLRKALRLAVEWNLLTKAPKIKMIPGEHQREFVITEDLLKQMLAHEKCTAFLKNLIPFLIDTGLRISECLSLTWDQIGLDPKPGARMGWLYVAKGKSKFAKRHVPLTKRAHAILHLMKEKPQRFVFAAEDGERLSRYWPSEQFRTLRDAMKLSDDCVIHSCRHTFCTRLGEAGAGAFTIQKLAGHSSITISQRYVHPTDELLESSIDKMQQVSGAAAQ